MKGNLRVAHRDSSCEYAVDDDRKLFLGENNIRTVFCHVLACVNGYSCVCCSESNAIIYPVSKHTNSFAVSVLETVNDLAFLARCELGKDLAVLYSLVEFISVL